MFTRDPSKKNQRVSPGVLMLFGVSIGCSLFMAARDNIPVALGLGVVTVGIFVLITRRRGDSPNS